MSIDKIKRTIIEIVSEVLQLDDSGYQNFKRQELPNWDSLKHMELILRLEETFHIQLSIAQVGAIDSVDDIETVVKQCLHEAQVGASDESSD